MSDRQVEYAEAARRSTTGSSTQTSRERRTMETPTQSGYATYAAYGILESVMTTARAAAKRRYDEGPGRERESYAHLGEAHPLRKQAKKIISAYVSRYTQQEYDRLLPQEVQKAESQREFIHSRRDRMAAENEWLREQVAELRAEVATRQAQQVVATPWETSTHGNIPPSYSNHGQDSLPRRADLQNVQSSSAGDVYSAALATLSSIADNTTRPVYCYPHKQVEGATVEPTNAVPAHHVHASATDMSALPMSHSQCPKLENRCPSDAWLPQRQPEASRPTPSAVHASPFVREGAAYGAASDEAFMLAPHDDAPNSFRVPTQCEPDEPVSPHRVCDATSQFSALTDDVSQLSGFGTATQTGTVHRATHASDESNPEVTLNLYDVWSALSANQHDLSLST